MSDNRIRKALSRWANTADQHNRDLREAYTDETHDCIADAPDRQTVSLRGVVSTVTLRPRGGVPALEAELDDGTGSIVVIWLGRRRIAGVSPGRGIRVQGRIGVQDGTRVMFNPRYELLP